MVFLFQINSLAGISLISNKRQKQNYRCSRQTICVFESTESRIYSTLLKHQRCYFIIESTRSRCFWYRITRLVIELHNKITKRKLFPKKNIAFDEHTFCWRIAEQWKKFSFQKGREKKTLKSTNKMVKRAALRPNVDSESFTQTFATSTNVRRMPKINSTYVHALHRPASASYILPYIYKTLSGSFFSSSSFFPVYMLCMYSIQSDVWLCVDFFFILPKLIAWETYIQ